MSGRLRQRHGYFFVWFSCKSFVVTSFSPMTYFTRSEDSMRAPPQKHVAFYLPLIHYRVIHSSAQGLRMDTIYFDSETQQTSTSCTEPLAGAPM